MMYGCIYDVWFYEQWLRLWKDLMMTNEWPINSYEVIDMLHNEIILSTLYMSRDILWCMYDLFEERAIRARSFIISIMYFQYVNSY
jgi:hypothetical protein